MKRWGRDGGDVDWDWDSMVGGRGKELMDLNIIYVGMYASMSAINVCTG